MIVLETERLRLEEGTPDDQVFILTLLNSPNWIEFIGDRGIESLTDAENYIHNTLTKSYKQMGFGLYKVILKQDNSPIGLCGFLQRDFLDHPDIGYAILPKHEDKGYTSEAAKAMLDYGKNRLGFKTILAITSSKNITSQRLLQKIGLERQYNEKYTKESNDLLFSISYR
ncbi:RimJ/RimL family protein N-acetyltransferase [Roseivirga ehrenbergii]|uniref:GCN5 family acetyltransferase n=1 Tax=Roseivirga ehrenbergii (strain DSM 102268 / JCM 13514 / KCTC 12282 / NCIMB 14502 / KMM 6017) TaxID=279360 RepID=A0A150X778_ROSEK|nr:GNAT family N-acetyltransferase [Roseivirga ehrenbergii]KYG74568.1 GCN5 family acetyltransferase [Roseivirga ehrenbergii]TCL14117.1 RimJ/RimL family protein N-acetyltransferase [Roseivirga ehrenbergii]